MTGRVVIVTGANSGIGYEVARYLCEGGNDVILACRSEERGKNAVQKIKTANPNALATFMRLDLASKKSVEEFIEEFRAAGKSLHVLVNSAGVSFTDAKRQFTTDGFEYTFGANHLGHFYLTYSLLDDLKKTASDGGDVRIVTVTSRVHDSEESKFLGKKTIAIDFENLMLDKEGTYNGHQAYKNSKAANVMFTYELARHLEGSGVTATCICPGFVPGTGLLRHNSSAQRFFIKLAGGFGRAFKTSRSVKQAAIDISNLVTAEKYKGVTGKYFRHSQLADSSAESRNEENQKKLWEMSGGYLHLEGFDPIEVPPPPAPEEEKKEEAAAATADAAAAAGEGEEKKEGEEAEKKEGEEGEKKEAEEEKKEEGEKEAEVKVEETKEETKEETTEEKKEESTKVEESETITEVSSDKAAIKAEEEATKIQEVKAE